MSAGREVRLVARPVGALRLEDLALAEVELRDLQPGEALVRNLWMSVDPAMRPRMDDVPSYAPPYALGAPLDGSALGEVVASRADGIAVGDVLVHRLGWRDLALLAPKHLRHARRVQIDDLGPTVHLSVLGHTGLTAYVGLHLAQLRPDDVVFVSGAAGATGSIAGQLATLRGHHVLGSAGSSEKVRHVTEELGFAAAFDYRATPVAAALAALAPDGIDVYFDNVGGDHLSAAIDHLRTFGRAVVCGTISSYQQVEPRPALHDPFRLVQRRLTIRGFLMGDHLDLRPAFEREVAGHLRAGRLVQHETVVAGLERAPEALITLLAGGNVGKMLVRLG